MLSCLCFAGTGLPGLLPGRILKEGLPCGKAFVETDCWCSRWTEGYFSRLLRSLGTVMSKGCYLRALFIHHESQRPLALPRGAHVYLSSSLLPEILFSLGICDATPSWFCLQLSCFFLISPAGSSSSYSWPLNFGVPWVLVSDHFPILAHSWDDLIHFQVYEGIPSVCWWPTFGCLIIHLRCNLFKNSFLSCFLNLHFLHGSSSQRHEWTRAK